MRQPKNAEIIKAVRTWQTHPGTHPLTCGNNSEHLPLIPVQVRGSVVLRCEDCGYEQARIPSVVLRFRV